MKALLLAFLAGFLATLVCHQGLFTLFWLGGLVEAAPYSMAPTAPFGVPKVLSLAFWGGLWGLPAWLVIRHAQGWMYWTAGLLFGGFGPSLVALAIVFPLKGMPFMGGWDPKLMLFVFLLNGAWGLGVAACMRLFRRHPVAPAS